MMMPRRVRKLRSLCARMDSNEARSSSPRATSASGLRRLVRLRPADEIARLQHAQLLEGPGDERLPFLQAFGDLDGQLTEETGGDRLEDRLAPLDQEHALLLLGRGRRRRI